MFKVVDTRTGRTITRIIGSEKDAKIVLSNRRKKMRIADRASLQLRRI